MKNNESGVETNPKEKPSTHQMIQFATKNNDSGVETDPKEKPSTHQMILFATKNNDSGVGTDPKEKPSTHQMVLVATKTHGSGVDVVRQDSSCCVHLDHWISSLHSWYVRVRGEIDPSSAEDAIMIFSFINK